MLDAGCQLRGRYHIERVLGQGGMGAVYQAADTQLSGKKVAIKEMAIMIADPTDRQRAVEQFHKEAGMLAQLDHPSLVYVTDHFEEEGKWYLVMAYVDGKTLEARLNEVDGFLSVTDVVAWMDQVCDVFEYLHSHSPPIIFRDMKPSNIMLDSRGRIRLIDFGIARDFVASSKTATFIKGAGTPGFAPLEQYCCTTDPRTDVYSLGATMYCLLTRTIPPPSPDLAAFNATLTPPS
ncbi:MAG: serine/threonine protein kinase, partial [Candidatus Xenobia bacterium]